MSFILPDPRLEDPRLLSPHCRPTGTRLVLDTSNPLGQWFNKHSGWVAYATPGGFYNVKLENLVTPNTAGNGGSFVDGGWENNSLGRLSFNFDFLSESGNHCSNGFAGFPKQLNDGFDGICGLHSTEGDNFGSGTKYAFGNTSQLRIYSLSSIEETVNPGTINANMPICLATSYVDSDLFSDPTLYAYSINNLHGAVNTGAASNTIANIFDYLTIGDSTATNIVNIGIAYSMDGYMPLELCDAFVRNPYQCLIPE